MLRLGSDSPEGFAHPIAPEPQPLQLLLAFGHLVEIARPNSELLSNFRHSGAPEQSTAFLGLFAMSAFHGAPLS